MTITFAVRWNNGGAILADRQVTAEDEKTYDTKIKVVRHYATPIALMGEAGIDYFLERVRRNLYQAIKRKTEFEYRNWKELVESSLSAEIVKYTMVKDKSKRQRREEYVKDSGFVFVARNEEGNVAIHCSEKEKVLEYTSDIFYGIGSGASNAIDAVDERFKNSKRERLSPVERVRAALHGVEVACLEDLHCGGSVDMIIMQGTRAYIPKVENVTLSRRLNDPESLRVLKGTAINGAVERLLFGEEDIFEVEESLRQRITVSQRPTLERIFRGYSLQ